MWIGLRATPKLTKSGEVQFVTRLSIAAKAYFLLKKKEAGSMSVAELIKQAEKYIWSISPESIHRAVGFLSSVGLATES